MNPEVQVEGARLRYSIVIPTVFAAAVISGGAARAYDFAGPPPGVSPGSINTFQFYVADQETYDDNLYRLAPGTVGVPGAIFPNASQSDAVNTSTLGGQGKWDIGRQEVEFNIRADENRFARNSDLNYVSSNAVGLWNWRVGPYFSGLVAAYYDRTLASFSETRFIGKDVVSSEEGLASGRYQVGPHWAVYGQIRGSYLQHSADAEKFNDFHNKAGNAGVEYATNVNDTYGFQYDYVGVTFKQDPNATTQAFNYKDDSGRFLVHYGLSAKTFIDAYGGYHRRQYQGVSISSYSGEIWRASLTHQFTDKTQVMLSAYRELHAYIDAESNYFVAKGVSIAPVWNVTDKLGFTLSASYENQDYIGSNDTVLLTGARTAKVNSDQATIRYTPRDAWLINIFFRHEKRDSNQTGFAYRDNLMSANVTFRFW
jgi:hypothetical protein